MKRRVAPVWCGKNAAHLLSGRIASGVIQNFAETIHKSDGGGANLDTGCWVRVNCVTLDCKMGEVEPIVDQNGVSERFERFASNLEAFLANRSALIVVAFTIFYIPYVCSRALVKPLWYDELMTIIVARLGSVEDIWRALRTGVDSHPPLLYVLTHWFLKTGGNELLFGRLPAMIGFWIMCVCLFLFTAKRGPQTLAILAMILPLTTDLVYYATEARPYGLVLGFAGSALLTWTLLTPSCERRFLKLLLLWASLAAAMFCHYFAVLLPLALFSGEAARFLLRRRIDWGTTLALGLSYASLFVERAIITGQTARVFVHWAKPSLQTVIDFYVTSLTPLLLPGVMTIVIVALYRYNCAPQPESAYPKVSLDEGVVIGAFCLLPFAAYLIGVLVTHAYTGRYAVSALIGVSLLFWWLAKGSLDSGNASSLVAAACIISVLGIDEIRYLRRALRTSSSVALQDKFPFVFAGSLPVVVQDPRDFLPMLHYGPPELTSRLIYVADGKLSMQYSGSVGIDVALADLVPWSPMRVLNLQKFEASYRHFLLFWGKPDKDALIGWQLTKFRDDGAQVSVVEEHGQRILFDVVLP